MPFTDAKKSEVRDVTPETPDIVCIACGRAVEQRGGRGRPRSYHAECKRLWKLKMWMIEELARVAPLMTDEKRREWRSELWAMSNYMNVRNGSDVQADEKAAQSA